MITARNSTFLHNARLFFNRKVYAELRKVVQTGGDEAGYKYLTDTLYHDDNGWLRLAMLSRRFASLDDMNAVVAEHFASAAAQPATVNAEAWTPAVGDSVRVKELDAYGTIDEIDTTAELVLYTVRDANKSRIKTPHDWYFTAEELEPAIAAPDAAQTAAADAVTDDDIRAYLTEIQSTDERRLYYEVAEQQRGHQEAYRRGYVRLTLAGYSVVTGAGQEWLAPVSAKALIDADIVAIDRLRKLRIANQTITERDEQIAALTRDLEAARASASALRAFASAVIKSIDDMWGAMAGKDIGQDERRAWYFDTIESISAKGEGIAHLLMNAAAPDNGHRVSAAAWGLTAQQRAYMDQRKPFIENAYAANDMDFMRDLAASDEYKALFGDMSWDEAYDRYEDPAYFAPKA